MKPILIILLAIFVITESSIAQAKLDYKKIVELGINKWSNNSSSGFLFVKDSITTLIPGLKLIDIDSLPNKRIQDSSKPDFYSIELYYSSPDTINFYFRSYDLMLFDTVIRVDSKFALVQGFREQLFCPHVRIAIASDSNLTAFGWREFKWPYSPQKPYKSVWIHNPMRKYNDIIIMW